MGIALSLQTVSQRGQKKYLVREAIETSGSAEPVESLFHPLVTSLLQIRLLVPVKIDVFPQAVSAFDKWGNAEQTVVSYMYCHFCKKFLIHLKERVPVVQVFYRLKNKELIATSDQKSVVLAGEV